MNWWWQTQRGIQFQFTNIRTRLGRWRRVNKTWAKSCRQRTVQWVLWTVWGGISCWGPRIGIFKSNRFQTHVSWHRGWDIKVGVLCPLNEGFLVLARFLNVGLLSKRGIAGVRGFRTSSECFETSNTVQGATAALLLLLEWEWLPPELWSDFESGWWDPKMTADWAPCKAGTEKLDLCVRLIGDWMWIAEDAKFPETRGSMDEPLQKPSGSNGQLPNIQVRLHSKFPMVKTYDIQLKKWLEKGRTDVRAQQWVTGLQAKHHVTHFRRHRSCNHDYGYCCAIAVHDWHKAD